MTGKNVCTFINNFYFRKLLPTTSTGIFGDCISNIQKSNEIRKEVKGGRYHEAFSLLRKQHLDYRKNVISGHLSTNSL